MTKPPRGAWLAVAILAGVAAVGPFLAGTPEAPSAAASAAQLLPPGSRVSDVALEGGGFVRAPEVVVEKDALVVVRGTSSRRLEGTRTDGPARARRMWLGSDGQGRDVAARLVAGARRSLTVALLAASLAVLLGASAGLASALAPAGPAAAVRLAVDAALSLPRLLVLLALGVVFRGVPGAIALAIGLVSWMDVARGVDADARAWLAAPAAASARAAGAGRARLAWRHLAPAIAPLLAVSVPAVACEAVLLEATLSYLGAGRDGSASWGRMIADGQRLLPSGWWVAIVPGVLLVGAALALHALGTVATARASGEAPGRSGLAGTP